MSAILYYITGHGYGHAVRSAQVIRALKAASPAVDVFVRTTAPGYLFGEWVPPLRYSHAALDVGMVQGDSLEMHVAETLHSCRALHNRSAEVVERERAFIRQHNIQLIVADIPPLAFEIAARAAIPAVAVTNFTWDFIYRAYSVSHPEFLPLAAQMQRFYGHAALSLELPYSCEMTMFRRREAIPWVTRVSHLTREEAKKRFALPAAAPVVLLSFGGYGLDRLNWPAIQRQREFYFVTTGAAKAANGNVLVLPSAQARYEDLIRACDVIVTKPGYGIVADALAHRVPVLYTDRGIFPEYPTLVQALNECATAHYISQSEVLAGELSPHLGQILDAEPHWPPLEIDGAERAARRVLSLLDETNPTSTNRGGKRAPSSRLGT